MKTTKIKTSAGNLENTIFYQNLENKKYIISDRNIDKQTTIDWKV